MDYAYAALLTLALVAACILIHYEALKALSAITHEKGQHRRLVLVSMVGALSAHVVEIWLFGAGYWLADRWELGTIIPISDPFDYVYYSAIVYTTVGFGDLIPAGPARLITSAEALSGLALITWSASFTYLQMQREWPD